MAIVYEDKQDKLQEKHKDRIIETGNFDSKL